MDNEIAEAPKERMSWEEIGKELSITPAQAEHAFERGMGKLRNKLPAFLLHKGMTLLQEHLSEEKSRGEGYEISKRRKAA